MMLKEKGDIIITKVNHLNEIKLNNKGTPMKIIEYTNTANLVIEFQDKHKYKTPSTYCNFKRGTVKNPYDISICGVGYIGVGIHLAHDEDGNNTKIYETWINMLDRCYSEKRRKKYPAYEDCTVCDEWLCFQNYAEWYVNNYYDIGEGRMHIDKDIIEKDNKIYSPDKCIFVPQRINMIFMKKDRKVDADLPTGIHRCVGGFQTSYNTKSLGVYKTLDEALFHYNNEKQLHINKVAEEYKGIIHDELYYALLSWNRKVAA